MIFFIIGLITGGFLTILLVFIASPGILLKENRSKYSFEESIERLEKVIQKNEWLIPVKHDLQATLIKLGKSDVSNVTVIEICNPDLSEKILKTDDERIVANLMPCRIAVYKKEDGFVYYSRMNSGLLSKAMGKVTKEQMTIAARETEKFLKVLN